MAEPLILGTRGSALALWQAHHVRDQLVQSGVPAELRVITTTGDQRLDVPLASIGAKGLFTRELDDALRSGEIHLAVHSLKDLPSTVPDGLWLAAVTERQWPFDAFVAHPESEGGLQAVPPGGVIGTSSMRRQAQLRAWRPDLMVVPLRGNVDTRLRKLDQSTWHGIILAEAGLTRLGFEDRVTERVPMEVMVPAVGQGALGVVCAADRLDLGEKLRVLLHDEATGHVTRAERAFLRRLEGGCSVPVGAHARLVDGRLTMVGFVGSVDGTRVFRDEISGRVHEAEQLGTQLAERMLVAGGAAVLAALRKERGGP